MTTVNRVTKPNGGTSWVDGDEFLTSDINGDVDALVTAVNGNLENDNLSGSAGITAANIANGTLTNSEISTSAAIDPAKLDDFSADNGEHNTTEDPGTSDSNTRATDLTKEIQQLRYGLLQSSLGANAKVTDGASDGLNSDGAPAWFDGSVIGQSVVKNGSFLDSRTAAGTAPYGWTVVSSPSTLTNVSLDVDWGSGEAVHIVDAGAGARDGIQQTLAGLKADSLYLVVAAIKPITTDWNLRTTGAVASGTFQNLDLTTASGGSTWEILSGLVQTDSTPTDIVVQLLAESSGSEAHIAFCHVYPVGDDPGDRIVQNMVQSATSSAAVAATIESDTTLHVVVPGPGYHIAVSGKIQAQLAPGAPGGDAEVRGSIEMDVDDQAFSTSTTMDSGLASNNISTVSLTTKNTIALMGDVSSPTPGSVYSFRLTAAATDSGGDGAFDGSTDNHKIRVHLIKT